MKRAIVVILVVLIIDQVSKFWIKTNMMLGEEIVVFDWFRILFVENNGMAFGFEFGGGKWGKLFLTLFRLGAIGGIAYWLYSVIKKNESKILQFCLALIFAGAMGNILDSVFYGLLFDESHRQVAGFLSGQGGYAPLFFGKVVDMLYFPLWRGYLPEWIPIWGGKYFVFFEPVFNIADSAITCGMILMLLFYRKAFPKKNTALKQVLSEEV